MSLASHQDTLSLASPFAHDLDSEVIEWRAEYDRAARALDDAAVIAADELADHAGALELERRGG